MPLYADAEAKVKSNLSLISSGTRKVPVVMIGELTERQFNDINAVRRGLNLNEIESREVAYIGRHHFNSRVIKDGYSINDMWLQIKSAMSSNSIVITNPGMTSMYNNTARSDGYGNFVYDKAMFELTQRKPRAELYSTIPKGDENKPQTQKAHP